MKKGFDKRLQRSLASTHTQPIKKNVFKNYQLAIVGRVGNYTEGASGQTEGSSPPGTPLETLKYRPRAPHQAILCTDKDRKEL